MNKNDEIDKNSDEQNENRGLLMIFVFVAFYIATLFWFNSCGSATCDAYHKSNFIKQKTVIDTVKTKTIRNED